jgi:hypothetical protein
MQERLTGGMRRFGPDFEPGGSCRAIAHLWHGAPPPRFLFVFNLNWQKNPFAAPAKRGWRARDGEDRRRKLEAHRLEGANAFLSKNKAMTKKVAITEGFKYNSTT